MSTQNKDMDWKLVKRDGQPPASGFYYVMGNNDLMLVLFWSGTKQWCFPEGPRFPDQQDIWAWYPPPEPRKRPEWTYEANYTTRFRIFRDGEYMFSIVTAPGLGQTFANDICLALTKYEGEGYENE